MYNEAQQKARNANSLGSIAFALDLAILIVVGKFVSPLIALVWFVIMCVGAKAHYDHVKTLASLPTEKELFTVTGEVRRNDDNDLMAADLSR